MCFKKALDYTGVPLSRDDLLLLSGFVVNTVAFVLCSVVMYNLSKAALKDEELAFLSALFFCWSPANPFFFSLYTESTFALFSFCGIYLACFAPEGDGARLFMTLLASCFFAVSTSIRSNGMVMAGFIAYPTLCRAYLSAKEGRWSTVAMNLFACVVGTLITVAPLAGYLYFAYQRYCVGFDRPWCSETIPNIYSFVQDFYWNVGFLRYFRPHQLPNFLLASPVLALSFSAIYTFIKSDWKNALTLGIFHSHELTAERHSLRYYFVQTNLAFYRKANFVFIAHLAALLATSIPFIHIQVLTRFLHCQ